MELSSHDKERKADGRVSASDGASLTTASPAAASRVSSVLLRHGLVATLALIVVIVAVVLAWNALSPITFFVYNNEGSTYARGTVESVDAEQLQTDPVNGRLLGSQRVTVRVRGGAHDGEVVSVSNELTATQNVVARPGLAVTLRIDEAKGAEPLFMIFNYDRTPAVAAIVAVFAACMVLAGGSKGAKSLLGLAFALFLIIAFMLPAIYRGISPVAVGLVTALVIAVVSMLLLNGWVEKTAVAIASTGIGVVASVLLYAAFSALLRVSGYNTEAADDLLVVQNTTHMDVGQLLFVAVVIASLGAVMDMCMSVATSLFEMKRLNGGLTRGDILHSGMEIGRDMIGTMCQTLILAFVGSAVGSMLSLVSYGVQPLQLLASDYIAVETMQSFVGALAVVLSVPVTTAVCALVLAREGSGGAR